MTILRLRAELADERGRLGGLASAIAACHGNILGIDVHFVDGARVADEFIIEFPQGCSAAPLTTALRRAGGIALEVEELDEHALVDPVARAIDIAAILLEGEDVAGCIAQLVRADNAEFVSEVEGAAADVPLTGRNRIAFPDPDSHGDGTARRWLVVEGVTPPFS